MRRVLPVLIVALALVGGVVWYGDLSRGGAGEAEQSASAPPPPAGEERELEAAPPQPSAPEVSAAPATALPPNAREAAANARGGVAASWIEGRVLFPPGTPADEEVHVLADRERGALVAS